MTKTVEFFFDYGSPFTYLAWTQLPALAERTGATIVYRPMLLGGLFKEIGNASPASVPAKGTYMTQDLKRCAAHLGVPFERNSNFPIMTLGLMRGAYASQKAGCFDEYCKAVFAGIWNEDRNLNEPSEIHKMLVDNGLDADALIAGTQDPEVKEALKSATAEAASRGAFGAPTFFVGDDMFFGHDRMNYVEAALKE